MEKDPLELFIDRELYDSLKGFEDTHKNLTAALRRLRQGAGEGNPELMQQALARYSDLMEKQGGFTGDLLKTVPAFEVRTYLLEEFHPAFMAALEEEGLAVEADYPVYEVFPVKIRVLPDRGAVQVDDKIVRCLRPKMLVQYLKRIIKKLNAGSFDGKKFLLSLSRAYDLLLYKFMVDKEIRLNEQEVLLKDVYNVLTPLPQHRQEYSLQRFAFDLHRLLRDDCTLTPDGRQLWLGNVRNRSKAVVVPDAQGRPQRYGVIKFYRGD
ncbi:MAG: hypothetical protein M1130_04850 [Actinobacteria bacterium]|nr:hypothetical protein [Actinomycetota bacterium]